MRRITRRNSLKSIGLALFLIIVACSVIVKARDGFVKPGTDLDMGGIPPIPKSLADKVRHYTYIYGLPLAGWAPDKRERGKKHQRSQNVFRHCRQRMTKAVWPPRRV